MQRTVSLNGREFELVTGALSQLSLFMSHLPFSSADDKKMYREEVDKLIKRLKDQADAPVAGVFIDGVRQ